MSCILYKFRFLAHVSANHHAGVLYVGGSHSHATRRFTLSRCLTQEALSCFSRLVEVAFPEASACLTGNKIIEFLTRLNLKMFLFLLKIYGKPCLSVVKVKVREFYGYGDLTVRLQSWPSQFDERHVIHLLKWLVLQVGENGYSMHWGFRLHPA